MTMKLPTIDEIEKMLFELDEMSFKQGANMASAAYDESRRMHKEETPAIKKHIANTLNAIKLLLSSQKEPNAATASVTIPYTPLHQDPNTTMKDVDFFIESLILAVSMGVKKTKEECQEYDRTVLAEIRASLKAAIRQYALNYAEKVVADKIKEAIPYRLNVIEKGYRPIGRLDTAKPPQGGSVVKSPEQKPKRKTATEGLFDEMCEVYGTPPEMLEQMARIVKLPESFEHELDERVVKNKLKKLLEEYGSYIYIQGIADGNNMFAKADAQGALAGNVLDEIYSILGLSK